jgi:hypothetical protein
MDPKSLERVVPVKITGFASNWDLGFKKTLGSSKAKSMDLSKPHNFISVKRTQFPADTVSGVFIPVDEHFLRNLDEKEKDFARGQIDISQIQFQRAASLPRHAIFWIYEGHTELATNFSNESFFGPVFEVIDRNAMRI